MTIANPSTFAFYNADQLDTPGFSATVMKANLDVHGNYLSSYIQTVLLPGLHSTAASTSGAAQIGCPAIVTGSTKYTVQGQITDLATEPLTNWSTASAHGSIVYRSSNAWEVMAPSTTAKFILQSQSSGANPTWADILPVVAALPAHYERDILWAQKSGSRTVLQTPNRLTVNVNNVGYALTAQADINLATAANWDTITPTDYTAAAARAGKDFYVYACTPVSGTVPKLVLSANSTVPSGYDAATSRKLGGFHCLCVAVGTISGHTLTGYVAGDILPASVWDLKHRPVSSPEGMVYVDQLGLWVDIYLQSGTGATTASAYGGTITDTRTWMDHVDDLATVKKRMLDDGEFQVCAEGSNQETNITGSADPGTTGGHVDTASRRMVSNFGLEDCCGVVAQWLRDQSYQHPSTVAFNWYDLGSKGSLYNQGGTDGTADVKLLAGGYWTDAATCGSRARSARHYRWLANANIGCRGKSYGV
jgi:hypothetical protein